MSRFIVTATARATIKERWEVEATDAEQAEATIIDGADLGGGTIINCLGDETVGDEEDREVVSVEPVETPKPYIERDEHLHGSGRVVVPFADDLQLALIQGQLGMES